MIKYLKLFFLLPLLFLLTDTAAQVISKNISIGDTTQVHILNTVNGDRFVGRVVKIENTTVTFLFKQRNELKFELSEIENLRVQGIDPEPEEESRDKYESERRRYAYKNSQPILPAGAEANFFGTTAFTYGKGNGEYRNTMIILNRIDFGLGQNIDVGFDLMPLISVNFVGARLKAGFPLSENVSIGFGASTYAFFTVFDDTFGGSHTYAVATLGSRDKYLNFGYGYLFPYKQDFFTDPNTPVVNFGGSYRFSERWRFSADIVLLTDNFYEVDFINIGAAWFNRRNRFDFGLTIVPFADPGSFDPAFIPVPFATYAFMFGKNR